MGLEALNDLATGDLNGDGHVDLVVTQYFHGDLLVRFGVGDGTFLAEQPYPSTVLSSSALMQVIVADINGDGFPDVLHNEHAQTAFYVRLNSGDGTLLPTLTFVNPGPYATTRWLAVGDLNGDGRNDVIKGTTATNNIWAQLQQ